MGYLVFAARLQQIKRKKSNLNMRLMHISNQKMRIAEQIANAQKAKTARQNLFNSTVRTTQNALQTIMGIGNATSAYINTQQAMAFGAATNQNWMNLVTSATHETVNGKMQISIPESSVNNINGLSAALSGVMTPDGKGNYVLKEGKSQSDYNAALNNYFSQQQQAAYNQQIAAQVAASAGQMAMQGIVQAGNYFMDIHNQINDFCDSAELEQLNNIDAQLEQEQTNLQTQLKALDAEEGAVEKALDENIKKSAPKFA